jgi:hypothetical protein
VRADRDALVVTARCAVLGGLVLLLAVPVYVYLEAPWRAVVPRLAAAGVLGIVLLELRAALAQRLARHPASALDAARVPAPAETATSLRLRETAAGLRAARRSRRHFEQVLWPRLQTLATKPLTPPPTRRGRGPSLAGLRAVIAALESQR